MNSAINHMNLETEASRFEPSDEALAIADTLIKAYERP